MNILAECSNRDKRDNGYYVGNRVITRNVPPGSRKAEEWSLLFGTAVMVGRWKDSESLTVVAAFFGINAQVGQSAFHDKAGKP